MVSFLSKTLQKRKNNGYVIAAMSFDFPDFEVLHKMNYLPVIVGS
jgi:hypothetical protein